MQNPYPRLLVALVPILVLSPAVAQAETPAAGNLLPLELRAYSHQADDAALETAAYQVNQALSAQDSDLVTITDVVQVPFIEDMLDENGNLDLPLGITVFSAMGDFSVGFGSDF